MHPPSGCQAHETQMIRKQANRRRFGGQVATRHPEASSGRKLVARGRKSVGLLTPPITLPVPPIIRDSNPAPRRGLPLPRLGCTLRPSLCLVYPCCPGSSSSATQPPTDYAACCHDVHRGKRGKQEENERTTRLHGNGRPLARSPRFEQTEGCCDATMHCPAGRVRCRFVSDGNRTWADRQAADCPMENMAHRRTADHAVHRCNAQARLPDLGRLRPIATACCPGALRPSLRPPFSSEASSVTRDGAARPRLQSTPTLRTGRRCGVGGAPAKWSPTKRARPDGDSPARRSPNSPLPPLLAQSPIILERPSRAGQPSPVSPGLPVRRLQ